MTKNYDILLNNGIEKSIPSEHIRRTLSLFSF